MRCRSVFWLDGGGSFFSDVCDCQSDELYAADDDGQKQGVDDQQDQACCVEYTGYKCVFCHAFVLHFLIIWYSHLPELFLVFCRYCFFAVPALSWIRGSLSSKVPAAFLMLCYYFRKFGGFFPSTEVTFAVESLHFCNESFPNQSIFRIISRILRAQIRISSFVI